MREGNFAAAGTFPAHLEPRRPRGDVENGLQPLQTVTCRAREDQLSLGARTWANAQPAAKASPAANPPLQVQYSPCASACGSTHVTGQARPCMAAHPEAMASLRTALHCQGAAMSKVGGTGGLPRRLPGRLVPPLVLLPLALHGQGCHQLPALRLKALGRRECAVALAPEHLHAQRAGAELVGRKLQGLLLAAARRRERLEVQRDLRRAALAVDRHQGLGQAPSCTAVDEQQGLRQRRAAGGERRRAASTWRQPAPFGRHHPTVDRCCRRPGQRGGAPGRETRSLRRPRAAHLPSDAGDGAEGCRAAAPYGWAGTGAGRAGTGVATGWLAGGLANDLQLFTGTVSVRDRPERANRSRPPAAEP